MDLELFDVNRKIGDFYNVSYVFAQFLEKVKVFPLGLVLSLIYICLEVLFTKKDWFLGC